MASLQVEFYSITWQLFSRLVNCFAVSLYFGLLLYVGIDGTPWIILLYFPCRLKVKGVSSSYLRWRHSLGTKQKGSLSATTIVRSRSATGFFSVCFLVRIIHIVIAHPHLRHHLQRKAIQLPKHTRMVISVVLKKKNITIHTEHRHKYTPSSARGQRRVTAGQVTRSLFVC